MNKYISTGWILGSVMLLASAAYAADSTLMTQDGKLVDAKGMTVYTFDKDSVGSSNCNDACAKAWPPVMADASAVPKGDMTVLTRQDGTKQWAYKGKPVYTYVKDTKAGEATGDNFKDIWHIVKP